MFAFGVQLAASSHSFELSTCAVAAFVYDGKSWADVGVAKPGRFTLEQPK